MVVKLRSIIVACLLLLALAACGGTAPSPAREGTAAPAGGRTAYPAPASDQPAPYPAEQSPYPAATAAP